MGTFFHCSGRILDSELGKSVFPSLPGCGSQQPIVNVASFRWRLAIFVDLLPQIEESLMMFRQGKGCP